MVLTNECIMEQRIEKWEVNHGIKGMQIRYSAICIHLDHARGYINQERIKENLKIWKKTEKEKLTWTDYGIKKNL